MRNESVSLQQFVKSTLLTCLLGPLVRFTVILNTENEQCSCLHEPEILFLQAVRVTEPSSFALCLYLRISPHPVLAGSYLDH